MKKAIEGEGASEVAIAPGRDAGPMSEGYGLEARQLQLAFPFHLVVDRELRVAQAGDSIRRLCPGLEVGEPLSTFVTITSPRTELGFDALSAQQESLFVLETRAPGITLRGQVVPAAEMGVLYFLVAPAQGPGHLAEGAQTLDEEKAQLAAAEQALAQELSALPDLVLHLTREGVVLDVRPARDADLSLPPDQLLGMSAYTAFPEMAASLRTALERTFLTGKTQSFEYEADRRGRPVFYEARVVRSSETHALALVRDVSERRSLEHQLVHQAFHDALTGLANRALFEDRVEHALARASRHGQGLSVVFIDLDDFKRVNDTLGHRCGDELLVGVAERLQTGVRAADTVARLGGDEFAVLIEQAEDEVVDRIAERMLAAFHAPYRVEGDNLKISASIGVASSAAHKTAEDLLRNADIAMYSAKGDGKGRIATYAPEMEERLLSRLVAEGELREAVRGDQLVVLYQPVYDLPSGNMVAAEALVRWQHPSRGLIAPLEFIPLAEETGLIVELGAQVLRKACFQAAEWGRQHPGRGLMVSVNLSPRQLVEPDLGQLVSDVLEETGLDPGLLILEITETALMRNVQKAVAALAELRQLGVQLALDDFGTGYSSLSHLRQFPIDTIKIDKSFIDGLTRTGEQSAIARAVLEIGKILGVDVVAEGVESEEQLAMLRNLDCRSAQGYLFSQPVTSAVVGEMLAGTAVGRRVPLRV